MMSFLPKVHAIYQDASGLLAARVSDSHSSDGSKANGVARTMKDYISQPIRLMDRTSLRSYQALLERELNVVRATLNTLEANEHVLAGGGHGSGSPYVTAATAPTTTTPKGGTLAHANSISPSNTNRGLFQGNTNHTKKSLVRLSMLKNVVVL
jgi:hypothetical protein